MQRSKLLFFLAVWKRPEITEICFMGLNRLARTGLHDLQFVAVISEETMKPLCKKYGIDYVIHKNEPLGEKKNVGLTYAMQKDFDFMVEIGSDDLLKNEFLELYPFTSHVYGLRDFIVMNSEDGECRRLTDRDARYGVGRAVSKESLKSCLCADGMYRLWNDKIGKGLDNNSTWALAKRGFLEKRIKCDEPLAIDIKSETNIWPFAKTGIEYPFEKAVDGLSPDEITALQSLHVTV